MNCKVTRAHIFLFKMQGLQDSYIRGTSPLPASSCSTGNTDAAQSVIRISTKLLCFATCLVDTGLCRWKSKANPKARFHAQQFLSAASAFSLPFLYSFISVRIYGLSERYFCTHNMHLLIFTCHDVCNMINEPILAEDLSNKLLNSMTQTFLMKLLQFLLLKHFHSRFHMDS